MAIMSAGMHFSGMAGGMRKGIDFLHWQCIHIGTQANGFIARQATFDNADNARAPDARDNFVAPEGAQFLGYDSRGAVNIVIEFRVLMQVTSPSDDFICKFGDPVDNGHFKGFLNVSSEGSYQQSIR